MTMMMALVTMKTRMVMMMTMMMMMTTMKVMRRRITMTMTTVELNFPPGVLPALTL